MARVSRSTLEWIYSLMLLAVVLISWGYVIYATQIAAKWQLREDYPAQTEFVRHCEDIPTSHADV
ncbi:small integral membrane protein 27 [Rhineura floridana]|uniref:small integral membrane protein 27 n=1 Tax=Rhineura floridana TaxID=261503 RepID=UPI002AC80E0D|nr:small integral membrane protein 27 [Rhineura floridana]